MTTVHEEILTSTDKGRLIEDGFEGMMRAAFPDVDPVARNALRCAFFGAANYLVTGLAIIGRAPGPPELVAIRGDKIDGELRRFVNELPVDLPAGQA